VEPIVELVLDSDSPDATLAIGRAIGGASESGLVIGLIGPLGAGKTLLVRGIAQGLEVNDPRLVCSPTFVLLQEYSGRLPVYHFDTYRLSNPEQFAQLAPEEYFDGDGVSVVEWADRVRDMLPADRLEVQIEIFPESQRKLRFRATGAKAERVLGRIRPL
jgi:tRNA threonylcarbamoyladenosine biosynthesis protein TsaE